VPRTKKALTLILTLILVTVATASAVAYSSAANHFWFTRTLTAQLISQAPNNYEPEFEFNISDSGKNLGNFYLRVEPIYPNQTLNEVYISFEHLGNTNLDSIDFRFSSTEITRVYLDTSDPEGIDYIASRDYNSFSVFAHNFGQLGTMQGADTYLFILYDVPSHNNSLFFSADISMHYMTPLQLTSLKTQVTVNTVIPTE